MLLETNLSLWIFGYEFPKMSFPELGRDSNFNLLSNLMLISNITMLVKKDKGYPTSWRNPLHFLMLSEHLRCAKWQWHQKRVNNNLLTYLEWLWTAHSGNVGHVYSFSYKQPFQSECSSNTLCWSLLQGIHGELWRLQLPSSSSSLLWVYHFNWGPGAAGVSPVPLCTPWAPPCFV